MRLSLFSYGSRTGWLVLALLVLLIMLPLAAVILQVLLPGFFFGSRRLGDLSLLGEMFRRPLWYLSLKNTLVLGIGTTLLGTAIGAALATARSRWAFPGARLLDGAVWLLIVTPSFILAQGWVMFASSDGLAANWFGWRWVHDAVFTPAGLIVVMSLSKFPFAYLAVHAALEWKMDRLGEAGRLNGGGPWTVWRTIEAPLLLPAYCSGALLVFMDTVGDFGLPASIAAVFRYPTLPYSIYSALYTSPIRFDMAGVLSFYLVVIIAMAMSVQFWALRRARFDFLGGRATRARAERPAKGGWLLAGVNLLLLAFAAGVPLGANLLTSVTRPDKAGGTAFTLEHFKALFASGGQLTGALLHSLEIAAVAAVVGLMVGLLVAYVLTYSRFKLKRAVDVISLISLAVPGVVLGIGYIFIWNQAWLERIGLLLYGKPAILVLAGVAGAIPVITRIVTGAMAKVPQGLLSAAQMQGASFFRRLRTILLPLLRGALLSAALAAFGASVFDLAMTSILFPPNFMTLPVVINKAFEDLNFGYAAAATLTGGGAVVGLILIAERLFKPKEARRQGL